MTGWPPEHRGPAYRYLTLSAAGPGGSGERAGGRSFTAILLDRIPAIHAANSHPYRCHRCQSRIPAAPLTSGPAGATAGDPRSTGGQATRANGQAPWQASPHPRCQAASLPPPLPPSCIPAAPSRAGMRACGWAGPPAIPARPKRRRRATPALWRASPHPRCQATSLPPPSPPIRIRAANPNPYRRRSPPNPASLPPPSRAGPRACGRASGGPPLDRNAGDPRPRPGPSGLPSSALPG